MRLAKFCGGRYAIQNLARGQLFFNNLANLNDPYEGEFRYKISHDRKRFTEFYLKYFGNADRVEYYFENKPELTQIINQTLQWRYENNAICCFSDESCVSDILMWSHYTDKHKGLCLVFDDTLKFATPQELNSTNRIVAHPTGPHRVRYIEDYPDLDPLKKEVTQLNFLTTKFNNWRYEKEFRFIAPVKGAYMFEKRSLREVIVGLHFDPAQLKELVKIVTNSYPKTSLRRVSKINDQFGLTVEDLAY